MPSRKDIPKEPSDENLEYLYEELNWSVQDIANHVEGKVTKNHPSKDYQEEVSYNWINRKLKKMGYDTSERHRGACSNGLAKKLWEMEPEDL